MYRDWSSGSREITVTPSENIEIAAITAVQWKLAFEAVKNTSNYFFEGRDIFVNLPTGFKKSLILQCLPIVADIVHSKYRCCCSCDLALPLLMEDQVLYLNNMGMPPIAITDMEDPEII